jgi:hypothetical protein
LFISDVCSLTTNFSYSPAFHKLLWNKKKLDNKLFIYGNWVSWMSHDRRWSWMGQQILK